MAYTWYLPFGGYRPGSAPTQTITDRDFTGQRENMELGLLYYNARFYAPTLGRFISADTIILNPANPQSYNRYSYVLNRALNFTDPTGHKECNEQNGCDDPVPAAPLPDSYIRLSANFRDRGKGVIVAPNAILTHNHFFNKDIGVTPETLSSISVRSADGDSRVWANSGEFTVISGEELGGMNNGLILIVFENDLNGGSIAPMSRAGSHLNGIDAYQSGYEGTEPGLYNTQITDGDAEFIYDGNSFSGIRVAPDITTQGDSGSPLYVDGAVVGVNNQGNGQCGAITNVPLIHLPFD
jgi:RHS repeat-associated protein